jgi:hypothetical protein
MRRVLGIEERAVAARLYLRHGRIRLWQKRIAGDRVREMQRLRARMVCRHQIVLTARFRERIASVLIALIERPIGAVRGPDLQLIFPLPFLRRDLIGDALPQQLLHRRESAGCFKTNPHQPYPAVKSGVSWYSG